jgi:hypothetical protein
LNRSLANFTRTACIALACVLGATTTAAPPTVERFGTATWTQLQQDLPRPSAVVFTATYCSNCPAILAQLATGLHQSKIDGEVIAVVIDAQPSSELTQDAHYVHATRLFVFDGNETALRYGVDPRWRGVTPYTALLHTDGTVTFVAGTPSDEKVREWLNPTRPNQQIPAL